MDMQKQAEARGHYSGEQRPRGGWPPTVLEAAQLAVDSSETWLKWNKKLGVKVPSSTGPAPAAPQKAQRYSLRSQGPRGTQ